MAAKRSLLARLDWELYLPLRAAWSRAACVAARYWRRGPHWRIAPQVFWGPLAYAMIGGIFAATLLTLFFLPALYMGWYGIKDPVLQTVRAYANGREEAFSGAGALAQ